MLKRKTFGHFLASSEDKFFSSKRRTYGKPNIDGKMFCLPIKRVLSSTSLQIPLPVRQSIHREPLGCPSCILTVTVALILIHDGSFLKADGWKDVLPAIQNTSVIVECKCLCGSRYVRRPSQTTSRLYQAACSEMAVTTLRLPSSAT